MSTEPFDEFLLASSVLPKVEDEPYKGDFGDEGVLDQPHATEWYLERYLKENQGNVVNLWASICAADYRPEIMKNWNGGEPALAWFEWMREHGLKLMTMYSQGHHGEVYLSEKVVRKLAEFKDSSYLGECMGEYLNNWFSSSQSVPKPNGGIFKNLREIQDCFVNHFLAPRIKKLKNLGYPRVFTASNHALAEFEIDAGVDMPVNENVAAIFNVSDMRGACKKLKKTHWGLYINHDWYTRHIAYGSPRKSDLLRGSLYQAWMNGASLAVLESGNLWTEGGFYTKDSDKNHPFESEHCAAYRKIMKEFYEFTKGCKRHESGPEVTTCFARGFLDGYTGSRFLMGQDDKFCNHYPAVWGSYAMAREDYRYFYGPPELGWHIYLDLAYPLRQDALAPERNRHLTGTPFGSTDVVGIDANVPRNLLNSYNIIVYTGWNTMEPVIYRKLTEYVKQGGTLVMGIPHLSTRNDREFWGYTADDLVNGGDLSELFGVKVTGKGRVIIQGNDTGIWNNRPYDFYEGMDIEGESGEAMNTIPDFRVESMLADLELEPDTEKLFQFETRGQFKRGECNGAPLLVRKKLGKGAAYLLACWDYPGAPGVRRLYTHIVKNLLHECRNRKAYISDPHVGHAGKNCVYIHYTVYPDRVYLLNNDCAKPRKCNLHLDGQTHKLEFAPGEFKIIPRK